jgi:uncharacterized protein YprB with RNaseH-like and TPR domain
MSEQKRPRILVFDIETLPMEVYAWGIFDQNIGIDMVKQDFTIASFAAKYVGEDRIIYADNRDRRNVRDDKELVRFIQRTLDDCDVLLSQNGIKFDLKKINSRAYFNHLPPIGEKKKHVDLLAQGRQVFGHTSHKLAWITKALDSSFQKSSHKEFPGFDLWREVMAGNTRAWNEMKKYNIQDIIATEAVYHDYMTWFPNVDLRPTYRAESTTECRACGSPNTIKHDKRRSRLGLFRRYKCNDCGCVTTMKGAKFNLDKVRER